MTGHPRASCGWNGSGREASRKQELELPGGNDESWTMAGRRGLRSAEGLRDTVEHGGELEVGLTSCSLAGRDKVYLTV